MDENYKLKYIKYKNKYLNLCKDILTNSKHKTENYPFTRKWRDNKNKLNFNQIGGANINILFSCTSFNKDSTLYKYFNFIDYTINYLIPEAEEKTALCITLDDTSTIDETSPLVITMKRKNYKPNFITTRFITYIENILILARKHIDVLVLAECDDFVTVFMNEFFSKNIVSRLQSMNKDKIVDFAEEFYVFKNNLFIIYNSLNGYIINIYHNRDHIIKKFTNIENSISSVSYRYILLHFMCCKLFNELFKQTEQGIYTKKEKIITPEEYEILYKDIYKQSTVIFFGILEEDAINKEEKYNEIFKIFIPQYCSMEVDTLGEKNITQIIEWYTSIKK